MALTPKLLAVLGALALAIGAGMVYLPAGVIVAGLELLASAYVTQYLEVRGGNEDARRART